MWLPLEEESKHLPEVWQRKLFSNGCPEVCNRKFWLKVYSTPTKNTNTMITHWSTNTLNLVFKGSAIKKIKSSTNSQTWISNQLHHQRVGQLFSTLPGNYLILWSSATVASEITCTQEIKSVHNKPLGRSKYFLILRLSNRINYWQVSRRKLQQQRSNKISKTVQHFTWHKDLNHIFIQPKYVLQN